jgi:hypothetical protein
MVSIFIDYFCDFIKYLNLCCLWSLEFAAQYTYSLQHIHIASSLECVGNDRNCSRSQTESAGLCVQKSLYVTADVLIFCFGGKFLEPEVGHQPIKWFEDSLDIQLQAFLFYSQELRTRNVLQNIIQT